VRSESYNGVDVVERFIGVPAAGARARDGKWLEVRAPEAPPTKTPRRSCSCSDRASSTAAPAPAPTFGGISPVTTPVPLSGAEAPAPSPAGADHSNGAAVTLFAWQSVVLGAAGVAATMI
jgi:hypothetical protein